MSEEIVKPPYKSGAEVDLLVKRLREVEILEVVTYDDITKAIGENSRTERGRNIIQRARNLILDEGYVFEPVRKIGYRRCDDPAKIIASKKGIHSINKKSKGLERTLETVDFNELDKINRESYVLNKTVISILRQSSDRKFIKAAGKKQDLWTPNTADLLKLLGKGKEDS